MSQLPGGGGPGGGCGGGGPGGGGGECCGGGGSGGGGGDGRSGGATSAPTRSPYCSSILMQRVCFLHAEWPRSSTTMPLGCCKVFNRHAPTTCRSAAARQMPQYKLSLGASTQRGNSMASQPESLSLRFMSNVLKSKIAARAMHVNTSEDTRKLTLYAIMHVCTLYGMLVVCDHVCTMYAIMSARCMECISCKHACAPSAREGVNQVEKCLCIFVVLQIVFV